MPLQIVVRRCAGAEIVPPPKKKTSCSAALRRDTRRWGTHTKLSSAAADQGGHNRRAAQRVHGRRTPHEARRRQRGGGRPCANGARRVAIAHSTTLSKPAARWATLGDCESTRCREGDAQLTTRTARPLRRPLPRSATLPQRNLSSSCLARPAVAARPNALVSPRRTDGNCQPRPTLRARSSLRASALVLPPQLAEPRLYACSWPRKATATRLIART